MTLGRSEATQEHRKYQVFGQRKYMAHVSERATQLCNDLKATHDKNPPASAHHPEKSASIREGARARVRDFKTRKAEGTKLFGFHPQARDFLYRATLFMIVTVCV